MILNDPYKFDPGAIMSLYVLDTSALGGPVWRWHPGLNELKAPVFWQGNQYDPFPIEFRGLKKSSAGTQARPTITVANVSGLLSPEIETYRDLIGSTFTRKRTHVKYIDDTNFAGGVNPSGLADYNVHYQDERFMVNRKVNENKILIEWELATYWEVYKAKIPARKMVATTCIWEYKKTGECPWGGGPPYFKYDDSSTAVPGEDVCGKRLSSCKVRFGTAPLPIGLFPSIGRY